MTASGAKCRYIELPVFKPNDYFFKHHQREKEEKWETFARVTRELMAKVGNLKTSELSVEDKFEYKKLLYSKFNSGK
jgi:hypothetical protein